jgi:hypothetical protein
VVTRVLRAVEAVVVVAACRDVLGVWPTSVALAAVGMWWGLRTWHRIETRARSTHPALPAHEPVGHVAFARALAAVADAYLSVCEAEDDPDGHR